MEDTLFASNVSSNKLDFCHNLLQSLNAIKKKKSMKKSPRTFLNLDLDSMTMHITVVICTTLTAAIPSRY